MGADAPLEVHSRTFAVFHDLRRLLLDVPNHAVGIPFPAVETCLQESLVEQSACALQRGTHLATEQARLFPVLGWTPELEVIIVGIFGVDPALL